MLIIKIIHILAIISWMAGLLYLPRLFIYHATHFNEANIGAIYIVMEKKLLRYIMNPAMIVAFISGITLAYWGEFWLDAWFLVKFASVILMAICHMRMAYHRRLLANGQNIFSPRYFRIFNEIPTILMIIIVISVVLKF